MAKKFTQAGRIMRAKFAQLGEDDLLLDRFHGTDSISDLFCFQLELLAAAASGVLDGLIESDAMTEQPQSQA